MSPEKSPLPHFLPNRLRGQHSPIPRVSPGTPCPSSLAPPSLRIESLWQHIIPGAEAQAEWKGEGPLLLPLSLSGWAQAQGLEKQLNAPPSGLLPPCAVAMTTGIHPRCQNTSKTTATAPSGLRGGGPWRGPDSGEDIWSPQNP